MLCNAQCFCHTTIVRSHASVITTQRLPSLIASHFQPSNSPQGTRPSSAAEHSNPASIRDLNNHLNLSRSAEIWISIHLTEEAVGETYLINSPIHRTDLPRMTTPTRLNTLYSIHNFVPLSTSPIPFAEEITFDTPHHEPALGRAAGKEVFAGRDGEF